MKVSTRCPKCGSNDVKVKSKQVWPLPSLIGALTVDLHVCKVCGYIETYESRPEKAKKG
jgi:predicted nucleic-acid-binding Zn-ribbon protein